MKWYNIRLELFSRSVFIVTGKWDQKKFAKLALKQSEDLKPEQFKDPSDTMEACCWRLQGGDQVIWMEDPENVAHLAHEATHAIHSIARYVQIKFSKKSEEFFAYGIGYIIEEYVRRSKIFHGV